MSLFGSARDGLSFKRQFCVCHQQSRQGLAGDVSTKTSSSIPSTSLISGYPHGDVVRRERSRRLSAASTMASKAGSSPGPSSQL